MKNLTIVLLTTIMVLTTGLSLAQTGVLRMKDLEGLSNSAQREILSRKLKEFKNSKAATMSNIDPDKVERWAKLISGTIKTISKDLSVSVNEFVKTDVGKITMFLIVYRVIGADAKGILFGVGAWLLITPILLISFRHFHGNQKLVTKDEKGNVTDIKYIPRYEWNLNKEGGSDAKPFSAVLHVAMFVILTGAVLAIIV